MRRVFGGSSDGFCSFDPLLGREITRIHAGGYCVVRGDAVISTLLGSCVAVCLRDPNGPVAAMNHFLLPGKADDSSASTELNSDRASGTGRLGRGVRTLEGDCRYGDHAMAAMIQSMLLMGARRENLEAKVFGGGTMISNAQDIGRVNVDFAEKTLNGLGIPVLARDVGGRHHRIIRLFSESGRVLVSRGDESLNSTGRTNAVAGGPTLQTDKRTEH